MKLKKHFILLLTICLQISVFGQVKTQRPKDDVLVTTIIHQNSYVNDFEFLFSENETTKLDSIITNFEKQTTNQIAIVTLGHAQCDKENFENYTLELANTWGIGQRDKNNGILIAISKEFRQMRIHNGLGIEKILSDEATKKIVDDYFIPKFKDGNYFEGTENGLLALIKTLEEKNNIVSKVQNENFPKASFAGKWEREQRFHNLILEIKFEKNKDYATVTDVGTGEAPPIILHAKMQGNKLIITPQTHVNDIYIEIEIKNKKLIFSRQQAVWNENEEPLPLNKNGFLKMVYNRIRK